MALNLRKHQDLLIKAYKDVSNTSSKTNWALFGYEGSSSVLKVLQTGDGGLEEIANEVSSSQVQYVFCRVTDPTTNLNKFVLINWQGEGAREEFKIKCAGHLKDIQCFLKGAHVTINARQEDDIDADTIFGKMAKSTSANYNIKVPPPVAAKSKEIDPAPVSSVYQKVNIQREISIESREEFWARQEEEEKQRVVQERRKSQTERINYERERKAQDKREAEERERRIQERAKQQREMKEAERRTNAAHRKLSEKEQWQREQEEVEKEDEIRRKRSESLRKERVAEATVLLTNKAGQRKAFFEQKMAENAGFGSVQLQPPPARKVKKFQPVPTDPDIERSNEVFEQQPDYNHTSVISYNHRPEPQQSTQYQSEQQRYTQYLPEQQPSAQYQPEQQQSSQYRPEPQRSPEYRLEPQRYPEYRPEPQRSSEYTPSPQRPLDHPPEPPRGGSQTAHTDIGAGDASRRQIFPDEEPAIEPPWDNEEEDAAWNEAENEQISPAPTSPVHTNKEIDSYGASNTYIDESRLPPEDDEQFYENQPALDNRSQGAAGGLSAQAIYDYEAEEDGEITFDPGDIITDIDEIDTGWWIGTAPDGSRGMFPANYVERL